jgi:hypothetical protein
MAKSRQLFHVAAIAAKIRAMALRAKESGSSWILDDIFFCLNK